MDGAYGAEASTIDRRNRSEPRQFAFVTEHTVGHVTFERKAGDRVHVSVTPVPAAEAAPLPAAAE